MKKLKTISEFLVLIKLLKYPLTVLDILNFNAFIHFSDLVLLTTLHHYCVRNSYKHFLNQT